MIPRHRCHLGISSTYQAQAQAQAQRLTGSSGHRVSRSSSPNSNSSRGADGSWSPVVGVHAMLCYVTDVPSSELDFLHPPINIRRTWFHRDWVVVGATTLIVQFATTIRSNVVTRETQTIIFDTVLRFCSRLMPNQYRCQINPPYFLPSCG